MTTPPPFGGATSANPFTDAARNQAAGNTPVIGGTAAAGQAAPSPSTGNSVPAFGGVDNHKSAVDLDKALEHLPRARQFPMPKVDGRFNPSFGRWGQYSLPDVTGANPNAYYPRVTTIGKALEDSEFLDKWKTGRLLEGVARHREILDYIDLDGIAAGTQEARELMDELAERARESVGASDAGKFGDAVHAWSESVDLEQCTVEDVPLELRAHVAAYVAACRAAGIRAHKDYVERIIYCPYTGSAGRVDRFSVLPDGTLVVVDVKTTKNLSAGLLAISVQLAQYATATHMLSKDGSCWEPMPPNINQALGIVAHVPSDASGEDAYCDLIDIDLTRGIENMQRAAAVRESRREKRFISKGRRLRASANDYRVGMSTPPPMPVLAAPPAPSVPVQAPRTATVAVSGVEFGASQRNVAPAPTFTETDKIVARLIGAAVSLADLENVRRQHSEARAVNQSIGPWKTEYDQWCATHARAKSLS